MALSNFAQRTVSAAVLAPVVLFALISETSISNYLLMLIALIVTIISCFEWYKITSRFGLSLPWLVLGLIYILPFIMVVKFHFNQPDYINVRLSLLGIMLTVWATDIGAYIGGKLIGGKKLAPRISPGKTWAGAICGLLSAVFLTLVYCVFRDGVSAVSEVNISMVLVVCLITGLISIISQIGDLFESWVKRKFQVKDSGKIIPGHGGVLDRVDGLLMVFSPFALTIAIGIYIRYLVARKNAP